MAASPSPDEIYFFQTNGYLVVENFLEPAHVSHLRDVTAAAVDRRRHRHESGEIDDHIDIDGANTRILQILADDPAFVDLIDHPPLLPYVRKLLNPEPHFHASDAIWEIAPSARNPGWHIDGWCGGYRMLRPGIPLLQLKVGYFLSDMTLPDQGNLMVVPGSHHTDIEPDRQCLEGFDTFLGATQLCVPEGSCVMFHNALWHTRGPATRPDGRRLMLYYAYEHPWMVGNPEHWTYPRKFYDGLSPQHRAYFHGFAFDPPDVRWT